MAKILKKIYFIIPILVCFSFSIMKVKADSPNAAIQTDDTFRFLNAAFPVSSIPWTYKQLLLVNRGNFNLGYWYKYNSPYNYSYIKFKNLQNDDYYLFIFTDKNNEITSLNYDTTANTFSYFNCIPYSTCDWNTKSFVYHYITTSSYNYGGCVNYFNTNYSYGLTDQYSCNIISSFNSDYQTNIYYLVNLSSSNAVGLTNLINDIKNYEIEMPEGSTFSIDNVQIFPKLEPEEPEPEEPTPLPEQNLNKFYVPNYEEGQCIEILDKDTLRVFENENSTNYTDYYINSHYISKTGQVEVGYVKQCSTLQFTSIGYYRNDFPYILFIVGSLSLFSIFFLYVLYKRFRKR